MPIPPDPRPQRMGLIQMGEITPNGLATWDSNGKLQDASTATVVILSGLPTVDPQVAGQLWSNSGVLTVSAG